MPGRQRRLQDPSRNCTAYYKPVLQTHKDEEEKAVQQQQRENSGQMLRLTGMQGKQTKSGC